MSEAAFPSLRDLTAESRVIVAFTGAGISTESGIPDYRGPGGVWERGAAPTRATIRTDAEGQRAYWRERRESYPRLLEREPNDGHRALLRLFERGRLRAVITQNIDGLHQKAGLPPDRVVELHGTAHRVRCLDCLRTVPAADIQRRQEDGEEEPRCAVCGGPLRSATVLFGESLPMEPLRKAVALAQAADLFLVVGSSLVVNPAARIPVVAKQAGARLAIINREPTPLDTLADARLWTDAGPTLTALVRGLDSETVSADADLR
ncbi:MAG: Sir2 family NAD-dependent protein deacetylase [Chloroflexota bacterium]|nr:Sir2 family NAD-dependent protein deacetylase [Chloroflexota bacterium]